jgi:hypothetical protein
MNTPLRWALFLILLVGAGLAIWHFAPEDVFSDGSPLPRASSVSSLEYSGPGTTAEVVKSDDQQEIRHLLAGLRHARETKDHKCGDVGELTFHLRSGGVVKLGILPGHSSDYYEFRLYSGKERGSRYAIYRVPIRAFTSGMKQIGITDLPQPRK